MSSSNAVAEPARGRVCLGVIAGAHGVRGQVKIKTFTADPAAVAAYGPASDESGRRRFALTVTGRTKVGVIAAIAGIEDRDAALALKGTALYVDRAVLPEPAEDEFYHSDLIGVAAELEDGARLGEVTAVHDMGGGDLLEVAVSGERTVLLPFTKEVVPEIDLAARRLVVRPPPGLLEEAEQ